MAKNYGDDGGEETPNKKPFLESGKPLPDGEGKIDLHIEMRKVENGLIKTHGEKEVRGDAKGERLQKAWVDRTKLSQKQSEGNDLDLFN